jgi:hypothetical protein
MAASTGGAIKAFLENQGLGIAVYRDQAPQKQPGSYVVVQESLAFIPDMEDGAVSTGVETVQIDLYQRYKSSPTDAPPNHVVETGELPRALIRALHGSRLMTSGTGQPATTVYSVLVRNRIRMLELDNNLVHDAITADVFQTV